MKLLLSTLRYVIPSEDFEMTLSLVEIDRLHPHEEIQPKLLYQLMKALNQDQVLKHPIIVDCNSLTVLDGNHRTEALRKLGFTLIPACMVDYKNPRIKVECWYRVISKGNPSEESGLLERFWDFKSKAGAIENIADLGRNIALLTEGKIFLLDSDFGSLEEVYKRLKEIELRIHDLNLEVNYDAEEDAKRKLKEHKAIAVIATPPLNKELILKFALNEERFPCKTTRHIIPARPMSINFPLDFLKRKSLIEANEIFLDDLKKKHLKRLPSGSMMNGRRYDEPLFLFE